MHICVFVTRILNVDNQVDSININASGNLSTLFSHQISNGCFHHIPDHCIQVLVAWNHAFDPSRRVVVLVIIHHWYSLTSNPSLSTIWITLLPYNKHDISRYKDQTPQQTYLGTLLMKIMHWWNGILPRISAAASNLALYSVSFRLKGFSISPIWIAL